MVPITFYETVWGTRPPPGEAADRKLQVFAHEFWLSQEDLERSSCCARTYRNLTACATRRTDSVNVERKRAKHPHTTARPIHSLFYVAIMPSVFVFASYFSRWVSVLTVPVQTVTVVDVGATWLCGRPTSVLAYVKYCLVYVRKKEFLFNLILSAHTVFVITVFLFLHNRESGKLPRSDLNGNETAWELLLPLPQQRTRGERSLVQRCVVASFIQQVGGMAG